MVAQKTEMRNDFEVVLAYGGETGRSSLVDLSHISKWEVETENPDEAMAGTGVTLPPLPGGAGLVSGRAVCRMTPTRALIWDFHGTEEKTWLENRAFNDVTDGSALLFMTGEGLFSIMEQLTDIRLDLVNGTCERFVQGPLVGVPAKLLVALNSENQMGILVAVARGFGQSMVDTLLLAGREAGLSPAGEQVFSQWLGK